MRLMEECSESRTRCSCSRRITWRFPPRSAHGWSRRASSTSPDGHTGLVRGPVLPEGNVRAMSPMIALATVRTDIADYVSYLILLYVIMIFLYILLNMMFSLGLRMPYSRWFDAVMNFLRDVCEPYLRIFRRLIPAVGMFDFSPIIGIILLGIVQRIVVNAIAGT